MFCTANAWPAVGRLEPGAWSCCDTHDWELWEIERLGVCLSPETCNLCLSFALSFIHQQGIWKIGSQDLISHPICHGKAMNRPGLLEEVGALLMPQM